jgi:hypothetical protein
MRASSAAPARSRQAYAPKALDQWAARAKVWASGGAPEDLPVMDTARKPDVKPRDVSVYFIHEG